MFRVILVMSIALLICACQRGQQNAATKSQNKSLVQQDIEEPTDMAETMGEVNEEAAELAEGATEETTELAEGATEETTEKGEQIAVGTDEANITGRARFGEIQKTEETTGQ